MRDLAAGGRGAGKRDLVHARVADKCVARRLAVAGDDIDDAWREARLLDQLRQDECGSRRDLRGLDHHRVARREGRQELPAEQHERRVPRRDRRHYPERLSHRIGMRVRHTGWKSHAVQGLGETCVVVTCLGDGRGAWLHLTNETAIFPDLVPNE